MDGTVVRSASDPVSEAFSWDGSGLGAGEHTLRLEARDVAGNQGETSASVHLLAPRPVPPTPTTMPAGLLRDLGRRPDPQTRRSPCRLIPDIGADAHLTGHADAFDLPRSGASAPCRLEAKAA